MRLRTKKLGFLFLGVMFMLFYCEFLIYYVVIVQCSWPSLAKGTQEKDVLKVLMVTDMHISGFRHGINRVDKWRREWQMHRGFHTIIAVHNPEVVFVLGDCFDEGQWATDNEFNRHVLTFQDNFYVPKHIKMFVLVGNHDVGFHNDIHPARLERYYNKMNSSSAQLLTLKNNHFVLLNSMAMEGDSCNMCKNTRKELERISAKLNCSRDLIETTECENYELLDYSRPILLQHFPLHRASDAVCHEPDSAPSHEKDIPFRTKIDALSKEASDYLAYKIRPRAVFGGHTHYGCKVEHKYHDGVEFLEHTIPSFSSRNIMTPKYLLVSITPHDYAFHKCGVPTEPTLVITAVVMLSLTIYLVRKKI